MTFAFFCFVLRLAIIAAAAVAASVRPSNRRPNILLLITDDQDVVLGGADHMPFLNEHLMQQGSTFENFFVHTPTCCPSRSSILSGRYLHNIGVFNNSFEGNCYGHAWQTQVEGLTYAVYAHKEGYRTGYSGKYLNWYGRNGTGGNRVPPGWDKWLAIVGNSAYYNYNIVKSDNGGATASRVHHGTSYKADYFSDVVANRTLEMIRDFTTNQKQPFLIVNAWPAPHDPITPAPWAWGWYNYAKAPRTPNWNASQQCNQQKHWLMRQQSPLDSNWAKFIDNTYQSRLETLLSVDRHIDQFIKLLDQRGVLENTIIMYTSDNGFQLGQHRLRHEKYNLYEHDIRVPFVIRGPNIPKNYKVLDIALNIDIAPTIYTIVKNLTNAKTIPLPETMDGISFLPILGTNTQRRVDFLVSHHGEGLPACGVELCHKPGSPFIATNSFNNTYHCLRSIVVSKKTDFIYCRFIDSQNFVEFYNMTVDKWQLHNCVHELTKSQATLLDSRLAALRSCRGSKCRAIK